MLTVRNLISETDWTKSNRKNYQNIRVIKIMQNNSDK